MRALQISGRDLVLAGGAYSLVDGATKVVQDLRLALVEPLGLDRFHPGWGSRLDDFVGLPLDDTQRYDVQQEAARVVGNYAAVQRDKIQRDTLAGVRSRYQTADVLVQADDITVSASLDSVRVSVVLRTGDNQVSTVTAAAGA